MLAKGTIAATLAFLAAPAFAADVSQDAIDGCIDQLRTVGGADGQSGEVLSTEFSEANSLVMLRDRGNTVWRCLVSNDGIVAEMSVAEAADDVGGAAAGAPTGDSTSSVQVRFEAGTSGAELTGELVPGESRRYVLEAREGQSLYVRLAANGPGMAYQIFNPDQSFLLDMTDAAQEYRGELWQTGEHVVEVVNRANGAQSYSVIFGIE